MRRAAARPLGAQKNAVEQPAGSRSRAAAAHRGRYLVIRGSSCPSASPVVSRCVWRSRLPLTAARIRSVLGPTGGSP